MLRVLRCTYPKTRLPHQTRSPHRPISLSACAHRKTSSWRRRPRSPPPPPLPLRPLHHPPRWSRTSTLPLMPTRWRAGKPPGFFEIVHVWRLQLLDGGQRQKVGALWTLVVLVLEVVVVPLLLQLTLRCNNYLTSPEGF